MNDTFTWRRERVKLAPLAKPTWKGIRDHNHELVEPAQENVVAWVARKGWRDNASNIPS